MDQMQQLIDENAKLASVIEKLMARESSTRMALGHSMEALAMLGRSVGIDSSTRDEILDTIIKAAEVYRDGIRYGDTAEEA